MICYGCLLDHLADNRLERLTESKTWKDGWFYDRAHVEIRSFEGHIVNVYPWEYTMPGLDAAIHAAELLRGSVRIRVRVWDSTNKSRGDNGFAIQVWPEAQLICGDTITPLGDHQDDTHDHQNEN